MHYGETIRGVALGAAFTAVAAIAGSATAGKPTPGRTSASPGRTSATPRAAMVFGGTPMSGTAPVGPAAAPAPLGTAALAKLAEQVGGTPSGTFARVSAAQPVVPNKAVLVYHAPTMVASGQDYAQWYTKGNKGSMGVWINAKASERYLVDCAIKRQYCSNGFDCLFHITQPDGKQLTVETKRKDHLTMILDPWDDDWYGYHIRNENGWKAFSCEITTL